jgi:hypothetical protein
MDFLHEKLGQELFFTLITVSTHLISSSDPSHDVQIDDTQVMPA